MDFVLATFPAAGAEGDDLGDEVAEAGRGGEGRLRHGDGYEYEMIVKIMTVMIMIVIVRLR